VPLHLSAEFEFHVAPLELPDLAALPSPDRLTTCAAVALFVQRAEAALPEFTVTTETRRSSPRSVRGWTACRLRSSWPRLA